MFCDVLQCGRHPGAYSDHQEEVTGFALQPLKVFSEEQLIATGKHFPGRGESKGDAHWGLPTVHLGKVELLEKHVAPYKALIGVGLPAIMMAHTSYPELGVPEGLSAGMSEPLIRDFLRGELGFKGVITTGNMMMGGVLKKFEMTDAIVKMISPGCDLILCRDESPIRIKIHGRVRSGELSVRALDEKVARILAMRHENGGMVDVEKAGGAVRTEGFSRFLGEPSGVPTRTA